MQDGAVLEPEEKQEEKPWAFNTQLQLLVARQNNGSDCGVFAALWMVCAVLEIPFTVVNADKAERFYRKLLMEAILEGDLTVLIEELRGSGGGVRRNQNV